MSLPAIPAPLAPLAPVSDGRAPEAALPEGDATQLRVNRLFRGTLRGGRIHPLLHMLAAYRPSETS